MISFKPLSPSDVPREVSRLLGVAPELEDDAEELISTALELVSAGDEEIGVSAAYDCLIIRIFDGAEYYFYAPFMLSDSADFAAAVREVGQYAVKEEIPLIFEDADSTMTEVIESIFRYARSVQNEESGAYRIEIFNELMLAKSLPRLEDGALLLTKLDINDALEYQRLSTDEETNKYWGYDYKADSEDISPEYFYRAAESDRLSGAAVAFALRYGGKFIGEAVIQSFDLFGGASLAIRLLPEYRGRGLGRRSLLLLLSAAGGLGLKRVRAEAFEENSASVALFSRLMKCAGSDFGKVSFTAEL